MLDSTKKKPAEKRKRIPVQSSETARLKAIVKKLTDQFGSTEEALEAKTLEDYKNRQKNRELRERLEEIEAQLPPDGAIVLTEEEAKVWESVQGMLEPFEGNPEKLAEALKEHGELRAYKETQEKTNKLGEVSEAAGGFSVDILKQLGPDLEYDIKEIEGKKAVFVKHKEGDVTKETSLDEYAKSKWKAFEASFYPGNGTKENGKPATTPNATKWIPQNPGTYKPGGGGASPVDTFLSRRNAARTGTKAESKA